MGYMHIENLYRNQKILNFKRCYALEKVHGTSARVSWDAEKVRQEAGAKYAGLTFFGGGESNERFAALFDPDVLRDGFAEIGHSKVTVLR
jgi:hypothetical protein